MKTFRKPSAELIKKFLKQQSKGEFTYAPVGATAGALPLGYRLNHTRVRIGQGVEVFERAKAALRRWEQFRIGWAEVQPADAPIVPGTVVAIVAQRLGVWWLNACRVVYVVDEADPIGRFGFAYGTLPDHVGAGEERFLIEWDRNRDEVWYDILAYSRPHALLTLVGYPYMRWSQRLFGRRSAAAMIRAVSEPVATPSSP
ncbi:hypothetical protein BSF38_05163 [Paludisphaera borealis]|uniref:DUF1990 domain-containing protein n=2 Tax=Paludisphaera borealis TaxID=1387353 RepID=A0A1U7CXB2_9BACT|nr:hypothetical protein BSF38_05163 [Paludisphaera borealis]